MENILSKGKGVSRVEVMFEITADGVTWPSVEGLKGLLKEEAERKKRSWNACMKNESNQRCVDKGSGEESRHNGETRRNGRMGGGNTGVEDRSATVYDS